MTNLRALGFAILAAVLGVAPLAGQCLPAFNISVYTDGSVSGDLSTVYGYSNAVDRSQLCNCLHSNYQSQSTLYGPNGSQAGSTESGMESSVSTATDGVGGAYDLVGMQSLNCSCAGLIKTGGGVPIPVCPQSVSVSSQMQFGLQAGLPGCPGLGCMNYPTYLTGFGEVTVMTLAPTNMNWTYADIEEASSVVNGSNTCPVGVNLGAPCNATNNLQVGQNQAGLLSFGWPLPALASPTYSSFYDSHTLYSTADLLAGQLVGCQVACAQTYWCGPPSAPGSTQLGSFTVTKSLSPWLVVNTNPAVAGTLVSGTTQ